MSDTEVMAMPVGDSDDDKKEEIKVEISPGVPVGVGRPNRPQRHRLPEIKNYKFLKICA